MRRVFFPRIHLVNIILILILIIHQTLAMTNE